jgi:hypothetical protein
VSPSSSKTCEIAKKQNDTQKEKKSDKIKEITFDISNSVTGDFLKLRSVTWRRNLRAPKVSESISSEATAYA